MKQETRSVSMRKAQIEMDLVNAFPCVRPI
jgi:hypothetical protein